MTQFLKALVPGGFLTWIVSLFIGSAGSSGGYLQIRLFDVYGYDTYWSWPLMFAATGLSWAILLMMDA